MSQVNAVGKATYAKYPSTLLGEDAVNEECSPVSTAFTTPLKYELDSLENNIALILWVVLVQLYERDRQFMGAR